MRCLTFHVWQYDQGWVKISIPVRRIMSITRCSGRCSYIKLRQREGKEQYIRGDDRFVSGGDGARTVKILGDIDKVHQYVKSLGYSFSRSRSVDTEQT